MCPKLQEHTFMDRKTIFTFIAIYGFVGGIGVFATSDAPRQEAPAPETTSSFIVQGESLTSVTAIVRSVGGDITHELGVIRSVGAMLTAAEAASLRTHADIRRVYGNGSIEVAGKPGGGNDPNNDPQGGDGGNGIQETHYPTPITRREYSPTACMSPASMAAVSVSQCWIPGFGITMASSTIQPVMRA
jgi:hypothetical protein